MEIEHRFESRPVTGPVREAAHNGVRNGALDYARYLNEVIPECPEKTIAIRRLEEVAMWANKAIAQNVEG